MVRTGSFGDLDGMLLGGMRLDGMWRGKRSARRGALLQGAFPVRGGASIGFVAGTATLPRGSALALWGAAPADEVDVRKWPVPARLAFMVLGSLLLWVAIAMLLGLIR